MQGSLLVFLSGDKPIEVVLGWNSKNERLWYRNEWLDRTATMGEEEVFVRSDLAWPEDEDVHETSFLPHGKEGGR